MALASSSVTCSVLEHEIKESDTANMGKKNIKPKCFPVIFPSFF
jgi:hypothetical protein